MLLAFAAGLVSFFSPCVLPLVPGYVAFLGGATGVGVVAPARPHRPGRALAGAIAFVIGFSFVFVSIGTVFGGLGGSLRTHERTLQLVFGSDHDPARPPLRGVAARLQPAQPRGAGALAAERDGRWSGHLGRALRHRLVAVHGARARRRSSSSPRPLPVPPRGAARCCSRCTASDSGVPFLLAAVAADKMAVVSTFVRRHTSLLLRIGGLVLVVIGVLEITGTWATFVQWLQDRTVFSSFTSPI